MNLNQAQNYRILVPAMKGAGFDIVSLKTVASCSDSIDFLAKIM